MFLLKGLRRCMENIALRVFAHNAKMFPSGRKHWFVYTPCLMRFPAGSNAQCMRDDVARFYNCCGGVFGQVFPRFVMSTDD
jgi:hypothetical protein